jgi:hypothetical protein
MNLDLYSMTDVSAEFHVILPIPAGEPQCLSGRSNESGVHLECLYSCKQQFVDRHFHFGLRCLVQVAAIEHFCLEKEWRR